MDTEQIGKMIGQLETVIGTLKYQILNNIDAYVKQGVDPTTLDIFIKKPVMQAATSLNRLRCTLAKTVESNPAIRPLETKEIKNGSHEI